MPKKDPAGKKRERGEREEKATDRSPSEKDRESEKKKLPEPSGNLRRRSEWFKKRH